MVTRRPRTNATPTPDTARMKPVPLASPQANQARRTTRTALIRLWKVRYEGVSAIPESSNAFIRALRRSLRGSSRVSRLIC